MRARLLGTPRSAPARRAEIFLLSPLGGDRYEAMVSPGGKLKPGRAVEIAPGFVAEILSVTERRTRIVQLRADIAGRAGDRDARAHPAAAVHRAHATTPRTSSDIRRCTRARRAPSPRRRPGFTSPPSCSTRIEARGVRRAEVVLHVGAGTFKPVEVEDPALARDARGALHRARGDRPTPTRRTRERGGRVWAVGTTTVRTLESAADDAGVIRAGNGETRIFIRPPARPRAVDALVTNFHLPRSTLIMLVAAFAGYDLTMRAYREAIAERLSLLFLRRRDGDRLTASHFHVSFDFTLETTTGAARAGALRHAARRRRDAGVHGGRHARHGQGARPRRPARDAARR